MWFLSIWTGTLVKECIVKQSTSDPMTIASITEVPKALIRFDDVCCGPWARQHMVTSVLVRDGAEVHAQ